MIVVKIRRRSYNETAFLIYFPVSTLPRASQYTDILLERKKMGVRIGIVCAHRRGQSSGDDVPSTNRAISNFRRVLIRADQYRQSQFYFECVDGVQPYPNLMGFLDNFERFPRSLKDGM